MFTACRKDDRDKHLAAWCDGTRLERPDSGDHPLAAQTRSPPSGGARKGVRMRHLSTYIIGTTLTVTQRQYSSVKYVNRVDVA